jgi:hypothetical protein
LARAPYEVYTGRPAAVAASMCFCAGMMRKNTLEAITVPSIAPTFRKAARGVKTRETHEASVIARPRPRTPKARPSRAIGVRQRRS